MDASESLTFHHVSPPVNGLALPLIRMLVKRLPVDYSDGQPGLDQYRHVLDWH